MFRLVRTDTFEGWLRSLRDRRGAAKVLARLTAVEAGHFGDWASVGDGVGELRIHFGPGYRVYFARRGSEVVLLLGGGDKSTQDRDIPRAKELAARLSTENR